jgi:predicted RNA binding protein YcfA (HicA-like mRNA interferase family)
MWAAQPVTNPARPVTTGHAPRAGPNPARSGTKTFAFRTEVCEYGSVKGREFLRKVKRFADRRGLAYRWVAARGAGSHGTVNVGGRMTVVKDRKKDLGPGLLRAMCSHLGIDPQDL